MGGRVFFLQNDIGKMVWSGRVYFLLNDIVRWCGVGVSTFFRMTGKMVWSGHVYFFQNDIGKVVWACLLSSE